MGVWDEFCAVCGGPSVFHPADRLEETAQSLELKIDPKALKALASSGAWTNKWVGLGADGSEAELGPYTGYGSFSAADGGKEFFLSTNVKPKDIRSGVRYGVGAHVACYNVLRKSLGYSLRFADVKMKRYNLVEGIDYSDIAKYHDQDFNCLGMVEDGAQWMLNDPTKDTRNQERIVAKWRAHALAAAKKPAAEPAPAAKKPAAKEPTATKEPAAKKPAAKKPAAKKPAAKKPAAKTRRG